MTTATTPAAPTVDADLVAGVRDFFGDRSTPAVVAEAELSGMPTALWSEAVDLGLPLVGVEEAAGGSGGTLLDAVTVLRVAAEHSAPLPLLEAHLAGWLLADAGLPLPEGRACLTVALDGDVELVDGRLVGELTRVAFARSADLVAVLVAGSSPSDHQVALVRLDRATVEPGSDLAGQPRDVLRLDGSETVAVAGTTLSADQVRLRGSLLRSAQLAGGLTAASRITQLFTSQREQFGRPIAAFQAVQIHLVAIAQAATVAELSTDRAAIAAGLGPAELEVCAAKLVANEGARDAARAAHQAHGAIGMTREYPLHQVTRRLHAWRSDYGTTAELERRIGAMASARPSLSRLVLDDAAPEV